MTISTLDRSSTTGLAPAARVRPATPRVSVVVPAMNEARNLEIVLPQLPADAEVILVDGGSKDDSIATALRVRPDVVVVQQRRRGKGNALAAGFARVTGDIVVMFDADGSADAHEIPMFVEALLAGADFAKGTRFTDGGGSADITTVRWAGNLGLNLAVNLAFSTRFTDLCYGYNAFWADQIPLLGLPDPDAAPVVDGTMVWGDGFEIETVINCRFAAIGASITEVPSVEKLRIHGESNLRAIPDGMRVLRTIARERRHRATRPARDAAAALAAGRSRRQAALAS